jgi:hypothetical protein
MLISCAIITWARIRMISVADLQSTRAQSTSAPAKQSIQSLNPPDVGTVPHAAEMSLVMFSGGRDSTLAAMRLHASGAPVTLVTVTSTHLVGIESVHRRLIELSRHLSANTRWLQIRQPEKLRTDTSFYEQTCLPCHHAYVVASGVLASSFGARRLAFGYVGYQMHWPEQTPLAVERLGAVLARYDIKLELPVYDIASRAAAVAELERFGLSPSSLEQKCLRQITNVALSDIKLRQQIDLWEAAINQSMQTLDMIRVEVIAESMLGSLV